MAANKNFQKQEDTQLQLRISSLVAQLRCGDTHECREEARMQLLAIGSPAVPMLVEAIKEEKGEASLETVRVLSHIADPSSVEALVELLSDDDFDVRWEAIEGLSAIGYAALDGLLNAIIAHPGAMRLRNGAHHVLHHMASEGYYELLKPLMMAIEGGIPNVEVPAAARKVLSELARA